MQTRNFIKKDYTLYVKGENICSGTKKKCKDKQKTLDLNSKHFSTIVRNPHISDFIKPTGLSYVESWQPIRKPQSKMKGRGFAAY